MKITEELRNRLSEWRRYLHQHPELSFQEVETARFVSSTLEKMPGMKVETQLGYPTAVVGELSTGTGPVIAIRADMDALPIQEQNDCHYKSIIPGVMHACGHDAHTAIALGTAQVLSEAFQKHTIQGTVRFLFQPAEEHVDEKGWSGAPYMIQAGVLDNVDVVIALHMSPEHHIGEVLIHDGYSMANVDVFKVKINGTGGHGAYPHLGTDPFWMLSHVLNHLYGITGRRVSPLEPAVISIGKISGGSTSNVIPSEVEVHGTIRSYHPKLSEQLKKGVASAFSIAEQFGGSLEFKFIQEDPALYNHPKVNQLLKRSITNLYPDFHILNQPFGLGGEDFAHMTNTIPGAMFFLGCKVDDRKERGLHTPYFDIDESVLEIGTSVLAQTAYHFLNQEKMNK
ncbi:amidohydrolase [Oceanobacillus piezotolerans]|uniref:Amidohydrolase n=1 Tax=Oceanobacillus piezotolerans TaxID=2448030 RepID=A0A498DCK2_9BACI|nr:M20 family metallopeptidase [Oceanobacillus piezotolerans]RLL47776.1 amidohydrolase [Oceanobacillus piezotolerans]